jgi:hypothetical protein
MLIHVLLADGRTALYREYEWIKFRQQLDSPADKDYATVLKARYYLWISGEWVAVVKVRSVEELARV